MPVTGSRTRLRRRSGTYVPPSGGGGGGGGGDTGGGAWEGTSTGDLFASPSGNDGNSGTVGSPFKTVDKLISTLSPGQTGVLRAGTYPEDITVGSASSRGNSGTSSSRITICNYTAETPLITGQWYINCNYLTFRGLSLSYLTGDINRWSGQSLIIEYTTINGNDNDVSGIHFGGSGSLEQAPDAIVRRCRIKNITTSGDVSGPPHGIYAAESPRLVVEQCKFHDIGGTGSDVGIRGVQFYNDHGGWSSGTVRDCIIDRCNGGVVTTGSGHKVERTIITRCTTRQAVEIYSGSCSATNCHTHNNSVGNYESGVVVTTPTTGDPLYNDEAGRIYTPLGAGSPAAGKGTDW